MSIAFLHDHRGYFMKWIKGLLIFAGTIAIWIGASITARAFVQDQNEESRATNKDSVVIGYMQSRDRVVTISQGPKGTVYTVKNKDGRVLAENISEKDLKEKYPSVYGQVKYGLAGNDARLRKDEVDRIRVMKIRD
jgi:hypothetical protein